MTKVRVGINGLGRIGRTILREVFNRNHPNIEIVAVNNPGDVGQYLHVLRYDSVHGPFQHNIEQSDGSFSVNGHSIAFYTMKDPSKIPWGDHQIDVVIDATGKFKDKESLSMHLRDSVKKVIMCAPGQNLDGTFVVGINHESYSNDKHHVISNASCTTNCLAPVAKVLHENFSIKSGFMTTVHAYTSDQNLLDNSHKDLRRARAAALSMIPTSTGAAKAVGLVIPELNGKLDGFAIRVPTPNVSMVDLNVEVEKNVTIEDVNKALEKASQTSLKGVLKTETLPLVSQDYVGMRESSCVDVELTNVLGNMVKVVAWYDNEAGFSNRVIDLVNHVGSLLK